MQQLETNMRKTLYLAAACVLAVALAAVSIKSEPTSATQASQGATSTFELMSTSKDLPDQTVAEAF